LNGFDEQRVGVQVMKKITAIALALGASICGTFVAQADDIQFTTLPQTVQTTVIRETHIANPTYVTRVIRDENGTYAVTVRGNSGDQVVYVDGQGEIVRQPSSNTTTTTTTVQQPTTTTVQQPVTTTTVQRPATTTTVQQAEPAEQTVVTYDQVQQNLPRYQLLEKKGKKEVYYDRQTGQKVKVKRDDK
jgi:hypothetical protein